MDGFKSKYLNGFASVCLAVVMAVSLCGCGNISLFPEESKVVGGENSDTNETAEGPVIYGPDSFDSADTPILIRKDEEKKTLTFYNLTVGKNYTLEYDGTTCFYDKYGKSLTIDQIGPGDIVDVKFIKNKKHLTSIQLSSNAWAIEDTNRYVMDSVKREVTIGEDTYKISSDAVCFSDERQITEQDIIETDILTFRGIGNTVYSITVDKGHGYLRLSGHQGFIGGWIEIGNAVIRRVSEDMLITVPEGKYQVKISASGTTSEKSVVINRNSESSLDFSDVVFEKPKTGTILFSLNPTTAKLYIDGELTDCSEGVELTYGLHQLICKAEGYTSITQYLNVGQPTAGIDITLEKPEEADEEKESTDSSDKESSSGQDTAVENTDSSGDGNQSTGNEQNGTDNTSVEEQSGTGTQPTDQVVGDAPLPGADVTATYYKVYIDAPEGVEVYLDGAYVGICPCSFKKTEGLHIISLSRSGYITRSYTISVDSDDKDISFSFADLVKEP